MWFINLPLNRIKLQHASVRHGPNPESGMFEVFHLIKHSHRAAENLLQQLAPNPGRARACPGTQLELGTARLTRVSVFLRLSPLSFHQCPIISHCAGETRQRVAQLKQSDAGRPRQDTERRICARRQKETRRFYLRFEQSCRGGGGALD